MKDWINDRLSLWLGRCVETAGRHPLPIVVLALLLASSSLFLVATRLGVNADTEAMLSETLAYRQTEIAFERAFPHFDKDLILVIEAPTPEGARMAVEALVEALGAEPELFQNVFAPGTGDFFETYGLLYLDLDELDRLGDELARAQPFLGELSADPSLRGLFGLIERALGEDAPAMGVDLADVLRRLTLSVEAAAQDRDEPFFFESLLLGEIMQEDANRRLVVLNPVIDFSEFLPAQAAIERVREIVAELRVAETTGARVRITGDLALETDDFRAVSDQATVAGIASFLLVSLILFAALRSLRLILATVVTLLVGLVLTAAFATLGIGHLNLISVSFAVLFIGLAVDFGIHLCLRYQELAAAGSGHAAALREAGSAVGGSLVLCAITTAIGFYAFVPTDYSGVAELGLIAGTGMFISLV
ncbi:MAG: MMPL family transporter, partial [Myxococcota bacterium]